MASGTLEAVMSCCKREVSKKRFFMFDCLVLKMQNIFVIFERTIKSVTGTIIIFWRLRIKCRANFTDTIKLNINILITNWNIKLIYRYISCVRILITLLVRRERRKFPVRVTQKHGGIAEDDGCATHECYAISVLLKSSIVKRKETAGTVIMLPLRAEIRGLLIKPAIFMPVVISVTISYQVAWFRFCTTIGGVYASEKRLHARIVTNYPTCAFLLCSHTRPRFFFF